jgi:F-type H+-transporting ATPase subunit gamma
MANLKEIRNRIGSVKSTRKITSAMSRIAAARLRKAQTAMENARQYGTRMAGIVGEIMRELDQSAGAGGASGMHPLLRAPEENGSIAYLIVTADRGLCGGFNSGVNRQVEREIKALRKAGREVLVITIGRKGRDYLKTYKQGYLAHHVAPAGPDTIVDIAKAAALEAMALFQGHYQTTDENGEAGQPHAPVGEVRLVFNCFKNVITQEVRSDRLLPVPIPSAEEASVDGQGEQARAAVAHAIRAFEPDTKQLLDHLLPVAIETAIQQALYNSVASVVAARRTAMDSATDNATQLIAELTLQYNRERQAAITKELMEIIGGAEALK